MRTAFVLVLAASLASAAAVLSITGCGGSYTSDDTTANTIAARHEARELELCATDDAATCTPGMVRAQSSLAYCANAHELTVHSAPLPEAGVSCRPQ